LQPWEKVKLLLLLCESLLEMDNFQVLLDQRAEREAHVAKQRGSFAPQYRVVLFPVLNSPKVPECIGTQPTALAMGPVHGPITVQRWTAQLSDTVC
jgi:hypothetical protein